MSNDANFRKPTLAPLCKFRIQTSPPPPSVSTTTSNANSPRRAASHAAVESGARDAFWCKRAGVWRAAYKSAAVAVNFRHYDKRTRKRARVFCTRTPIVGERRPQRSDGSLQTMTRRRPNSRKLRVEYFVVTCAFTCEKDNSRPFERPLAPTHARVGRTFIRARALSLIDERQFFCRHSPASRAFSAEYRRYKPPPIIQARDDDGARRNRSPRRRPHFPT